MLNFSELKSAVGALLERADSNMATKLGTFINDGYRYINMQRPWSQLLRHTTFTSTAGLDYFITGNHVAEVIDVSQRQTPIVLALQRYYALLSKNIDAMQLTTGNASMASPMGEIGVAAALPADGTITVESSSALDVSQVVRVRGYDINLIPQTEEIALNGINPVTSTLTYTSKEAFEPRFAKSATTLGYITIKASTTTLAVIAPEDKESRYKKWKVWPAFQSSISMYCTYKKRITKLVEDEDTPEIECDNALIMFAFARSMQEKRQFEKAKAIYGQKDIDGCPQPGTFQAELDALVAREPQFAENFADQFIPNIQKDPIDYPPGQTGFRLWPR